MSDIEIKLSPETDKLFAAMSAFQGEVEDPKKTKTATITQNVTRKYADLEEVLGVCRPLLKSNGLSIFQFPGTIVDNKQSLTTIVGHSSGQWIQGTMQIELQSGPNKAQGTGIIISYARRYAIAAVMGLAQKDDDAETNGNGKPVPAKSEAIKPQTITEPVKKPPVKVIDTLPDPTAGMDVKKQAELDEAQSYTTERLKDLIEETGTTDEQIKKWLVAANVTSLVELGYDKTKKTILSLESKKRLQAARGSGI